MQLRFSQRCVDLLACYQFSAQSDAGRLSERRRWWDLLDRTLQSLPHRNILLVVGDFNCTLSQTAGHSGPSHFRWQQRQVTGKMHADQGHFTNILRVHGLNALNSWDTTLGPTYVKGDYCSRIDFVLVRQHYADRKSKDVKYLWDAPFLPSEPSDHVPMLCHIPKMWIPPKLNSTQSIPAHLRDLGRTAFLADTAQWRVFHADSADRLCTLMHTIDPTHEFSTLHTQLSDSFRTHFFE